MKPNSNASIDAVLQFVQNASDEEIGQIYRESGLQPDAIANAMRRSVVKALRKRVARRLSLAPVFATAAAAVVLVLLASYFDRLLFSPTAPQKTANVPRPADVERRSARQREADPQNPGHEDKTRVASRSVTKLDATLAPPIVLASRTTGVLDDFAKMVRAYTTAGALGQPLPVQVDFIRDNSGVKNDLPDDLAQYARAVVDRIGVPFQAVRNWPASVQPGMSRLGISDTMPRREAGPVYRIVGSLVAATPLSVSNRYAVDAAAPYATADSQAPRERGRATAALQLVLTLEKSNGHTVPGATVVYRIAIEKTARGSSFRVYVAGNGIGSGNAFAVTQDMNDVLYEATQMAVIHLLGNALLVPYYRSSAMFGTDVALDERVRKTFAQLTRAELEQNVKRFLFIHGYPMDLRGAVLTDTDRAIVAAEMQRRSFDPSENQDHQLVEFAMELWKNLDYVAASRRLQDLTTTTLARIAPVQRAAMETAGRNIAVKQGKPDNASTGNTVPPGEVRAEVNRPDRNMQSGIVTAAATPPAERPEPSRSRASTDRCGRGLGNIFSGGNSAQVGGSEVTRKLFDTTTITNSAALALGSSTSASVGGIGIDDCTFNGNAISTTTTVNSSTPAIGSSGPASIDGIVIRNPAANCTALALGSGACASIGGIAIDNSKFNGNAISTTTTVNSSVMAIGSGASAPGGGIVIRNSGADGATESQKNEK